MFRTYPVLGTALWAVGGVYLLFLAWTIATAAPMSEGVGEERAGKLLVLSLYPLLAGN